MLDIKKLVQQARYASARSVNSIMTAAYWEIGRRLVEIEQKRQKRADYGKQIIKKMSKDLTKSCGKGFGERNLWKYRQFYLTYKRQKNLPTLLADSKNTKKTQKVFSESIKSFNSKDLFQIQTTDFSNKILAAKHQTKLPSPKLLSQEIEKTKKILSLRKQSLFDDNKMELKKTKSIKKAKKSIAKKTRKKIKK